MDRDALMIYLRDLRDLEIAKEQLGRIIIAEQAQFNESYSKLTSTNIKALPEVHKVNRTGLFAGVIIGIAAFIIGYTAFAGGAARLLAAAGVLSICAGIVHFVLETRKHEVSQSVYDGIAKSNQMQEAWVRNNARYAQQLRDDWNTRKKYLSSEKSKLGALLTASYKLDILPASYRNLQSVYYIYDYMSATQASLNETLMHEHWENGIQNVLTRLDEIMENQQDSILKARRMEAQDGNLASAAREKLTALSKSDSAFAAQYAEIAARNAETAAYFAKADYFRKAVK